MIDVIFALLILCATLTSTYDLIIQTAKFKDSTNDVVEILIKQNEVYETDIQSLF